MTHAELSRILHAGIRNVDRKTFKEVYGFMRALKRAACTSVIPVKDSNNLKPSIDGALWSLVFCGVSANEEIMLGDIIFRVSHMPFPAIEHKNKWLMRVNYKGDSRKFVKQEDLARKLRMDMNKGIM